MTRSSPPEQPFDIAEPFTDRINIGSFNLADPTTAGAGVNTSTANVSTTALQDADTQLVNPLELTEFFAVVQSDFPQR